MKFVLLLLSIFISINIYSQSQIKDTIKVSFTKSVYLIFSNDIKTDFGSEEIFVKTEQNKITIQAGVENFEETNLLVHENDIYYMFIIKYDNKPTKFIYDYQNNKTKTNAIIDSYQSKLMKTEQIKNDSLKNLYEKNCQIALNKKQEFYDIAIKKGNVYFVVSNLFIKDNSYYYKLDLINNSNIKYDIDYYDIYIRKKQKLLKNSPTQDIIVEKKYLYNYKPVVERKSSNSFIIVTDKYTIDNRNEFIIELFEKEGDRHLKVVFNENDLLRVKPLIN